MSSNVCIQINQNPTIFSFSKLGFMLSNSLNPFQDPRIRWLFLSSDAKHVTHWQFYSSYKEIPKNITKWTKTRQSKSCLVCSKPTFYSYTKIFIGWELVPDRRHRQEWIYLFCQSPLMAKTASQKHLFPQGISSRRFSPHLLPSLFLSSLLTFF